MQTNERSSDTVVGAALAALLTVASIYFTRSSGPILWDDEGTYLQTAVDFARLQRSDLLDNSPTYASGYSIVLAPLVAILGDRRTYEAAMMVNIMAVAGIFVVSARLSRELLPSSHTSRVLLPLAATAYPPLLLQATRAWPEALLTFLISYWALSSYRFADRRQLSDWLALWAAASAAFITHHRLLPLLLAAVLTPLLTANLGGRRRACLLWIGAGLFMVTFFGAQFLDGLADTDAFERSARMSPVDAVRDYVASLGAFGGQLFSLLVGTVGMAAAAVAAPASLRHNRGIWIIAIGFLGTVGLTTLFLAPANGVDKVFYSRYLDVLGPTLVVLGVTAVLRSRNSRAQIAAVPLAITGSLLLAAWKLPSLAGSIVKIRVTSLLPWDLIAGDRGRPTTPAIEAWQIAMIVTAISIVLILLQQSSARLGIASLLGVNLAAALAAAVWSFSPWLNITEAAGRDVFGYMEERGETELLLLPNKHRTPAMGTARAVAYQSGYTVEVRDYEGTDCPEALYAVGTDIPPPYPADAVATSNVFKSTLWMKTC